jgi:protein-L-isoaspartate(D-aspartate) O-methyltransferase
MIFENLRNKMIGMLRERGISDPGLLAAMGRVERHKFVPPGLEHQAYDDKALPIGFGQTISHPYTVALMTETLNLKKGEKVLEIGTGSGYQAAILAELGAQVFTIEKITALGQRAKLLLEGLGYSFVSRIGDGTLGWQTYAPYDAVIITAGAPVLPESLLSQVKSEGRLIIPIGSRSEQMLKLYQKRNNEIIIQDIEFLKFVPLTGKQGW